MQSPTLGSAAAPRRILFLTPYFWPYRGGIERAIEQLSYQLLDSPQVAAVGVLTAKYAFPRIPHPEWASRERTPEGIDIFRLDGFPKSAPPLYSAPLVWFSPGQIRRYLEEFNPNVVHFVGDGWFWGHFWAWFGGKDRAKFIFTPSYHTLPASRFWLKPVNRFLCNAVDYVVPLTRQEREQVRRDYGVKPDKLKIIGWGASPLDDAAAIDRGESTDPIGSMPSSADPGLAGAKEPVNILCVGRLSRHKGQAWLLDAYLQARLHFRQPARLVLVGGDEDGATADLQATVKAAGMATEVIFPGELGDADLAQWYRRADLFALFSRYEAFGLVYFEAMLGGSPVLTHSVGANDELLLRGAVVVPTFDQAAAVRELIRLVNNDDYRRQLGADGREYARQEFTWPAVAQKYLGLYGAE